MYAFPKLTMPEKALAAAEKARERHPRAALRAAPARGAAPLPFNSGLHS